MKPAQEFQLHSFTSYGRSKNWGLNISTWWLGILDNNNEQDNTPSDWHDNMEAAIQAARDHGIAESQIVLAVMLDDSGAWHDTAEPAR